MPPNAKAIADVVIRATSYAACKGIRTIEDAMINPKIKLNVAERFFFRQNPVILALITIPNNIPIPIKSNGIKMSI